MKLHAFVRKDTKLLFAVNVQKTQESTELLKENVYVSRLSWLFIIPGLIKGCGYTHTRCGFISLLVASTSYSYIREPYFFVFM